MISTDRTRAIRTARQWLAANPLFLDTETTGLGGDAEICDLAVIDAAGNVLLDTLIRPTGPIPARATDVHGITEDMVTDAPTFAEVLPGLDRIVTSRMVVIYNRDYDTRLLRQSARAHGLDTDRVLWWDGAPWYCAMKLYAQFFGQWSDYHGSYTWQSLGDAARQCRLESPEDLHRARADAELTRRVVIHVAKHDEGRIR